MGDLRTAGHAVEAIDLPGSGADTTPVEEVTLDAYAERICAALAEQPEPAVLVGHSMGGMAITQASGRCPERISRLVYVAAFLPRDGVSLLELTQLPEGDGDQVQANIVVEGEPPVATLPAAGTAAIYNCCDEAQIAWVHAQERPQPVAPFVQPVSVGPDVDVPRSYVLCTRDQAIRPALQRRMIAESPCDEVIEIDTDHGPWLSAPEELFVALDRLARR
jgi:pimeloyl-ACP methyl ester carboxylesterase